MYATISEPPSATEWDALLARATVALVVATVALVVVGAIAAWVGIRQLKAARQTFDSARKEANTTARAASEAARRANEAVMADHFRRRGEATMAAVQRFVEAYSREHQKLLLLAREDPKRKVKEMLSSGDKAAMECLQEQLDALEVLSAGARIGIYDLNVIYHVDKSKIIQLWDRSVSYRNDLRDGKLDTRPPQASVYEHSKWLMEEIGAKNKVVPIQLDGTLPPILKG